VYRSDQASPKYVLKSAMAGSVVEEWVSCSRLPLPDGGRTPGVSDAGCQESRRRGPVQLQDLQQGAPEGALGELPGRVLPHPRGDRKRTM